MTAQAKTVAWTREKLEKLREERNAAQRARLLDFCVVLDPEGPCEFVTAYANHLIRYLDEQFAAHPDQPRQPYNEGEEGQ